IYRTHDGGKTWTSITSGLPDGATINTVKEDPKRKGLLFAGSETQVYVSLDDGGQWQSLRLNMPATSIRDLVIKDDDLVVGTHGRGFWILDDITALRQLEPATLDAEAYLFKPQTAIRFEWNRNTDTPLPPDEPAGQNPPDGAIIDYSLKQPASGVATLEILDSSGKLVRRYATDDQPVELRDEGEVPAYWMRPSLILSGVPGLHRFVWDLHYPPAPGSPRIYPIAAAPHDTAPEPKGPWVLPGTYSVRLTVNGKSYMQPLVVRMDPRVKSGALALQQQFALSKQLYDAVVAIQAAIPRVDAARDQARGSDNTDLVQKLGALSGSEGGRGGFGGRGRDGAEGQPSLTSVSAQLSSLLALTQDGSGPVPVQTAKAAEEALTRSQALLAQVKTLVR
ncbi:MAG TPA: hypothetical protein VH458_00130, partial [Vicinamibacterales bacterium]